MEACSLGWLGRALKLPGWKTIKRKPHPTGLEAKTTACAVTGVLIDFEFQEGTLPMGHFRCIDSANRSSAWLLRLTKHWHNTEQRTVIADAAFAQVRVAVALMRTGGLFLIGNVKGCTKCFCKDDLKAECGQYERNKLVTLTKKIVLGTGYRRRRSHRLWYWLAVHWRDGGYLRTHWRHQRSGQRQDETQVHTDERR